MTINIGYITGARSEFGLAKKLLLSLDNDNRFNLKIFVTGLHLLKSFGYTKNEILESGLEIYKEIEAYNKNNYEKCIDFSNLVKKIYENIKFEEIDYIYIIGDRLEAYGAALAAHFAKIPIIHSGGGNITKGALDDIYRYNISNLSKIHLTTSRSAYNRLQKIPIINNEEIYFVGSPAVDSIFGFFNNPILITDKVPDLKGQKYVLMTFHPVTKKSEEIAKIMSKSIEYLTNKKYGIIITYPNNDEGYRKILDVIKNYENYDNIFVFKNLGVEYYYAAINQCEFVIGNSSSGVIEVPYFKKYVIDVGSRQEGRDKDESIFDVKPKIKYIVKTIKIVEKNIKNNNKINSNYLYGSGNSIKRIKQIILDNEDK